MYKIVKIFSWLVVIIAIVNIICFLTYCSVTKHPYAGNYHSSITKFSKYPFKVIELAYHLVKGVPPTYRPIDNKFTEVNLLDKDLFALNSYWNMEKGKWDIRLINLRNDSLIHEWYFERENIAGIKSNIQYENLALRCDFASNDNSLIVSAGLFPGVWKFDLKSNVIWSNHELVYHHSMNFNNDNNIWTCASALPLFGIEDNIGRVVKNVLNDKIPYIEDYITLINSKTGAIIYKKGVSEILINNGYKSFVYGQDMIDPMHLNDVEPVLKKSEYWEEGDVFVSLRHVSAVFLYRPSTDKILKLIFGPLLNQHDVDIISPTAVSIFNNNCILSTSRAKHHSRYNEKYGKLPLDSLLSSEILIYDFEKDSFSNVYETQFESEKIYTISEGLHEYLSNGDVFVESQNSGKIYILNEEGFVLKKQIKSPLEGYAYITNWINLFEENPLTEN